MARKEPFSIHARDTINKAENNGMGGTHRMHSLKGSIPEDNLHTEGDPHFNIRKKLWRKSGGIFTLSCITIPIRDRNDNHLQKNGKAFVECMNQCPPFIQANENPYVHNKSFAYKKIPIDAPTASGLGYKNMRT